MWNDNALAGKRVLVTAGADGIGLEITRAFAQAGANVLVCDVQGASLERLAAELPAVHGCRADVASEADVAAMFETVDRTLGGLDILVNNAGVAGPTGGVETLTLADWERTLAVNITGQFLCTRLAVPRLRQGNSPAIVNLSSAAGHLGMPGRSAYSASKWAVIGFTKSLALELGADGIRVNAILPGAVDGPRIRAVIAAKAEALGKPLEDVTRAYTSQAALGRMVTARDIANMVLFASSDLAANVTGQALAVDGLTQALS
ncbi:short chain dehydrogenase [Cupriavidus basilensis OR16]|uniref:Short chain dehydrogenase n=1 Tax=Cupriavidus basilensis OR16 TaxID=1127483 RepID=H1S4E0_9BURK|nr:SDR family oxidoreductase [Cupriavidus basilensis]EHP42623.1 short chain dehydrogenase [Cupriavidus basilensis OR16]